MGCAPRLIEVSKDSIRDNLSIKALAHALSQVRHAHHAALAFAGTTDLIDCAGFSWERYRQYLAVQFAQARFLDSSLFRLLLGGHSSSQIPLKELIKRVEAISHDLHPIQACIEIHAGVESDPLCLSALLQSTTAKFVVDFENMQRAGLSSDKLLDLVPIERLAYFHQRNLPGVWIEHAQSLQDEAHWHRILPEALFLWEPKSVANPKRLQELYYEYQSTH
jgi:hypothetical protein